MRKKIDLTNKRFGRLLVLEYVGDCKWRCLCDCGNEKFVCGSDLRLGKTQSCGCLQRERTSKANTRHKMRGTRLHNIWLGMKQRCYYKKHVRFERYGGRGIIVCDEWKNDFLKFYEWAMSNGYSDNLTLDRIDNDGNYEPSNCRWVTPKEQFENQHVSSSFVAHMNKQKAVKK